jgi:hypothetical protein
MPSILAVDMNPHQFYELDAGYVLLKQPMKAKTGVELGEEIPLKGALSTRWLLCNGHRIGYYFSTTFKAFNGGGFLLAYIESKSKKGIATTAEVLLKIKDEIVIFHFPNRGTMAISPVVNEEIANIFSEQ